MAKRTHRKRLFRDFCESHRDPFPRITRRAAVELALAPGDPVHAILKTMSVARDHIARSTPG